LDLAGGALRDLVDENDRAWHLECRELRAEVITQRLLGQFRAGDAHRGERYWNVPETYGGKYLWTDDYYNLLNILNIVVDRQRR